MAPRDKPGIGRPALLLAFGLALLLPGVVVDAAPPTPRARASLAQQASLAPSARFSGAGVGGRLPVMGWNPWNAFRTDVNEARVMDAAHALVRLGLADAGYRYVNLDDGWIRRRRGDGVLEVRTNLFLSAALPDGTSSLRPLADRLHAMGLKLGVYSDVGRNSCAQAWDPHSPNLPEGTRAQREIGTMGYQRRDAALIFGAWNVDLIKLDACGLADFGRGGEGSASGDFAVFDPWIVRGRPVADDRVETLYADFARAIRAVRPAGDAVFSICAWGEAGVRRWGHRHGDMWRTSADIRATWTSMLRNFDSAAGWTLFAGPGHWNDPDMLVIGLGEFGPGNLTEARTHLSLWAMLSAPLILGHDVARSPASIAALVGNRRVIAIDQDPAGNPGAVLLRDADVEVIGKTLAEAGPGRRARALAFVNRGSARQDVSIGVDRLGLRAGGLVLRDLWSDAVTGADTARIAVTLEPHETRLFRVEGAPAIPGADYLEQEPARIVVAVDGVRALASPLPATWIPARPGLAPSGDPLRSERVIEPHGIGILAGSRMEVRTDGQYRAFAVTPSIQAGRSAGPVTFRVYGDGRLLATRSVRSGAQRAGAPIRVALDGVRVLELVAEQAGAAAKTGPVQVGWLRAVLTRSRAH